jgi:hypothetical protein
LQHLEACKVRKRNAGGYTAWRKTAGLCWSSRGWDLFAEIRIPTSTVPPPGFEHEFAAGFEHGL